MIKFTHAGILQAFGWKAIGTRVRNRVLFEELLLDAVKLVNFDAQTTPGQAFVTLPSEAYSTVSAGVGRKINKPDAYVLRSWRGEVGAYLKREHAAPVEGLAAIVYTVDAYLADPEVAGDLQEVLLVKLDGATHVIVAVLAFAGPRAPLSPDRLVSNLAGGNKDALAWDANTIRAKAEESAAYWAEWAVVAD